MARYGLLRWPSVFILSCCLLLYGQTARAHLMPEGKGTLNLVENKAYLVLSLPIQSLGLKSTDESFGSSPPEQELMREALRLRLQLTSPQGAASLERIVFNLPEKDAKAQSNHKHPFVAMVVARFAFVPDGITLRSTLLLGSEALELKGTLSEKTRTLKTEYVMLSASEPEVQFFFGPLAILKKSATHSLFHWVSGFDHIALVLAFLLIATRPLLMTLWIIVGFFTAFLIAPLTSFQGPELELAVALSVLMGSLSAWQMPTRTSLLSLFAFAGGLIHGLAFYPSQLSFENLASFNFMRWLGVQLGLNLGLILCATLALALLRLLRHQLRESQRKLLNKVFIILSFTFCGYWIAQRSLMLI